MCHRGNEAEREAESICSSAKNRRQNKPNHLNRAYQSPNERKMIVGISSEEKLYFILL